MTTTLSDPMRALEIGNRIRMKRAEVKRQVAAGQLSVADILEDYPPELGGMQIGALFGAQVRWGRQRTRKFLFSLATSDSRTLDELTDAQRATIAATLRRRYGR